MRHKRNKKLSKKESRSLRNKEVFLNNQNKNNELTPEIITKPEHSVVSLKKTVEIPNIITVRELSERLNLPVTEVIGELLKNGIMATINESIDYETAVIIADELGYEILLEKENQDQKIELSKQEKAKLKPRPPVVVILGHVDHGKTTLLDQIRKSNVVAGESGGITQHIGAYQVKLKTTRLDSPASPNRGEQKARLEKEKLKTKNERVITFLDTPGHEAFSAMRAHGANITDIAILVVAADDGVKPQTKEAISHAKAAEIPIIVAINKIDRPEADIEKVKRELADLGLNPEEWGGETVMVNISAKKGQGIEELLDLLLITADLAELKANPDKIATGVVIESHLQAGIGPVATVLIQDGTLHQGEIVVIGNTFGRVRRMEDYQGNVIFEAKPSMPVRIAGIKEVVGFGTHLEIAQNDKEAQIKAQARKLKQKKLGLVELSQKIQSGDINELNIVIKADVDGSILAIKNSLTNLNNEKAAVKIIYGGVGDITESDVNLAIATEALVLGFRTKPTIAAKNLAELRDVKISTYEIIYQLIDDIAAVLTGMIKPEIVEVSLGKLEVLKVFHSTKNDKIIGGKVIDGRIVKEAKVHHYHSNDKVSDGKIITLQMEKNPVLEVDKGFECGLGLVISSTIKPGDLLEAFEMKETAKKILKS